MIRRGVTLRSSAQGHIFVVLNDPERTGSNVLLVNFTTKRSPRDDNEMVFTDQDYALLNHESVIAFWGAGDGPATNVENAIRGGLFTTLPDVPERTLERIIEAAKASRHLSAARKALLN